MSCEDLASSVGGKLNLVYCGNFEGDLFNAFMTAAKTHDNYLFFHAHGDCADAHGAKSHGLTIFRNFDKSPIHYNGELATAEINSWIDKSSIPILIEFSEEYIEPIFGKGNPAVILFTNERESEFNKVFARASESLNGQILFVISGTENGI